MSDLKSQELAYGERIGSGGSDAVLAGYFRDIVHRDLKIDVGRFQALLDRYIIHRGLQHNTNEISTSRNALHRELMSRTMTWKVFIKGLKFLKVHQVDMRLTLFRESEKTRIFDFSFQVNQQHDESDEDTEDDNSKTGPNVLSEFFREIVDELKIDDVMFKEYLDYYVEYMNPGSDELKKYTTRCSLRREIFKNSISWRVFIKGLIFLKTTRVKFDLLLYHANGMITPHSKTIALR